MPPEPRLLLRHASCVVGGFANIESVPIDLVASYRQPMVSIFCVYH